MQRLFERKDQHLQEKVLHFVSLHPSVLHPTTSIAEAVHLR